jgi:hypothetical protein
LNAPNFGGRGGLGSFFILIGPDGAGGERKRRRVT